MGHSSQGLIYRVTYLPAHAPCGSGVSVLTLTPEENRNGLHNEAFALRRLFVKADVVPSSPILVTLMMEAPSSSETSVVTRATRRNIPEDDILYSHRRENLKSYIALTGWTL
jgi:hypothetical protein